MAQQPFKIIENQQKKINCHKDFTESLIKLITAHFSLHSMIVANRWKEHPSQPQCLHYLFPSNVLSETIQMNYHSTNKNLQNY